ncbi:hypothetical protein AB0E69_37365 [Kribbella sp. NPDC026611]|uniref:hypothetical protein n=1 Tax=Kribbella sp. NPDC026611 TaxID=3154911 RepID=UPI0034008E93
MDDVVELRGSEDVESLIERGRVAGALAALRAARESVGAAELLLVADGFGQLEHWGERADTLRMATELRPGDAELWAHLGDALVLDEQLPAAMTAYRQAVDLGPATVGDVLRALLGFGLEDEAIELFTAAQERHPGSASICHALAAAHGLSGDHARAVGFFRTALELDPEDDLIRWNLTHALARTGRSLEAWRIYRDEPGDRTTGPTRVVVEECDLSWRDAHPDLLRRLQNAIGWTVPLIRSGGYDRESELTFVFDIEAPTLRSTLVTEPTSAGVRFVVTSTDGTPVQDPDLRLWRAIVDEAVTGFRDPGDSTWFAVIGTTPGVMLEYADQRLRSAGTVAGIEITPCVPVEERTGIVGLDDDTDREIRPVLLEGAVRNDHDGGMYAHEEGLRARRMCALLSLAWNRCWTIKLRPHWEVPAGIVPDVEEPPLEQPNSLNSTEVVELPSWLTAAWKRIEEDSNLSDALDAFYEGMLLYREHPSLAMVAFVTCCETYGSRTIPGRLSKLRFRTALETVLDEEDAAELINTYYTLRNETAHQGKLHGLEKSFGLQLDRMVGEADPELDFTHGVLRNLRAATRSLLIAALGGD